MREIWGISLSNIKFSFLLVRINDTVTFVEDGFDEDIEFGDEISDDDEDDVDNVSSNMFFFPYILSSYVTFNLFFF